MINKPNYTNIFSNVFTFLTLSLFLFIFINLFYENNFYINTLSKQMTKDDLKSYKIINNETILNKPFDISTKQFEVYLKKNFESYTLQEFNWTSVKKENYLLIKPDQDIMFFVFFDPTTEKIDNIKLVSKFKSPDDKTSVSNTVMLVSKNKIKHAISAIISSINIKKYYQANLLSDDLRENKFLQLDNRIFNFYEYTNSKLIIVEVY